jgi:tRNA nucleotidyltransferase (CCA-adding enzyme)
MSPGFKPENDKMMKKSSNDSTIDPQRIPAFVLSIIHRLQEAGFKAYIVGGAVRDVQMNRAVADWDIATSATNDEIDSIFHNVRHFSLKHETVTLVYEKSHYEVTTMRAASPRTGTVEEDLGHRDFTINAMAFDLSKKFVIDPFNGRGDLNGRIIRAVGDPVERFTEDPLRLIRAIRLSVELGFKIESVTWKNIVNMSSQLTLASPERIREELMKILLVRRPSPGFRLLVRSGLLKTFLPELMEGLLMRQNHWHRYTVFRHIMETVDRIEPDPVLRLAALFHDIAKPRVREAKGKGEFRFHGHEKVSAQLADEIMDRLRFSKEMARAVTNLIVHHMVEYNRNWSDGAIRRLIRRFAPDPIDRLLTMRRADLLAHGVENKDLDLLAELEERVRALSREPSAGHVRYLALDGQKVMDVLGISPGPEVGKAIDFLMEKVTDQPELNTEEVLKKLLQEFRH